MTRRRRRLLVVALALAVLWAAAAVVLLVGAAGDVRDGRSAARRARDGMDAAAVAAGRPLSDLRQARDRFDSASAATGSPVLLPLRLVPVLGRQLRSVHALAGAAHEVSDAAAAAVARAHDTLREPAGSGPARVAEVRTLSTAVATAARRVGAVHDLGPRKGLVAPLADARNELAAQLADATRTLDDAAAGARAALQFLEGPRRYLVVAANNAEMRAGSGMWLSGGVLTASAGRLELGEMSPLYEQADPPNGAAPIVDRDLRERWGEVWHPNWDWRGLMVSPRMPASAATALGMWQAAGREPIDGVLVMDPVGLAAVVRATGPVRVGERSVTASEVVPELLNRQYLRFGNDQAATADRRNALGTVAEGAFAALDGGHWSTATLAGELAAAVRGRHLLAWSANIEEERGWAAAGLAGDLAPDSLLVSVLNRGGNKLDWYLPTEGRLSTRRVGDDTEVTARLRFRNTTPPNLPRYVAGPPLGQGWAAGTYVGLVAVDVPAAATAVRVDGSASALVAGRDGAAQVVTTELVLPRGQSREVVVTFRLRGAHGGLVVEPSARVPGITWRHGQQSWHDDRRSTTKW